MSTNESAPSQAREKKHQVEDSTTGTSLQDRVKVERPSAGAAEATDATGEGDGGPPNTVAPKGRGPTQAENLIAIGQDAQFSRDAQGSTWATFAVGTDGHRETHRIASQAFRLWLRLRYFEEQEGKAPGPEALRTAVDQLDAVGRFKAPAREVFARVGHQGATIYLDLADDAWRRVEIDRDGWRVVAPGADPAVLFTRPAGTLPLPEPTRRGDRHRAWSVLRRLLRCKTFEDAPFVLSVAWLLGTFMPAGPYAILDLSGEQGTGKSTLERMLVALVDPSLPALRRLPKDERDLAIAAEHRRVVAYDNLSGLPAWLADALCAVATGAGFGTRTLYANRDEELWSFCRPVAVNGISSASLRGDFADRALHVALPGPAGRMDEDRLWRLFEHVRPHLLGAILDAVVVALRERRAVELEDPPRMADFTRWVVAAEAALPWEPGTFLKVYRQNRQDAATAVAEGDVTTPFIRQLIVGGPFSGTAADLLRQLTALAGETTVRGRAWPKSPQGMASALRRLAPALRAVGIDVSFHRDAHAKANLIELSALPEPKPVPLQGSETISAKPAEPASPSPPRQNPAGISAGISAGIFAGVLTKPAADPVVAGFSADFADKPAGIPAAETLTAVGSACNAGIAGFIPIHKGSDVGSTVAEARRLVAAGRPTDAGRLIVALPPADRNRVLADSGIAAEAKDVWPDILAGMNTAAHDSAALGGGVS